LTGRTISHYRILEKLGSGGMGVVYKAEDVRLDRTVALKFLPDDFTADQGALGRFQREARAASALNHPNICTVYDIGEADGHPFIAMEYLEGQALHQLIASKPLTLGEVTDVAIQVADALQAAHSKGVVHRDIKPANIFITNSGQVKVMDFGVAKYAKGHNAEEQRSAAETAAMSEQLLSTPGSAVGTVAYMSPEQARGEIVDARTDVWSLGVVLYEMLAGQRPFRGDHMAAILHSILDEKPKRLRTFRADVPPELEHIAGRALEKDRESRYSSAAELRGDLVDYKATVTASESGPVNVKLLIHQVKRPRYAIPALVIVLALAGSVAWWVERSSKARWARQQAIPEIQRLIEAEKYPAAFALARQAERYIGRRGTIATLAEDVRARFRPDSPPWGRRVHERLQGVE
jgi:eukaryotic-like serine/threonine-protein kinase